MNSGRKSQAGKLYQFELFSWFVCRRDQVIARSDVKFYAGAVVAA
jgi:hypothetical protein